MSEESKKQPAPATKGSAGAAVTLDERMTQLEGNFQSVLQKLDSLATPAAQAAPAPAPRPTLSPMKAEMMEHQRRLDESARNRDAAALAALEALKEGKNSYSVSLLGNPDAVVGAPSPGEAWEKYRVYYGIRSSLQQYQVDKIETEDCVTA